MKFSAAAALLVAALARPAAAQNPVQKAVQLLTQLEGKIVREGEDSKKTYEEFTQWCEERTRNVGFEIKTGKAEVSELSATIESSAVDAMSASSKIEELASSIATNDADLKAAQTIRDKEVADFAASEKELVDIISTIERAIGILEREMRKSGGALMQVEKSHGLIQALTAMVDASMIGQRDASKLTALVQADNQDDEDAPGAPDAAAYEGKSTGIIDQLESLNEKAKDQLDEARKKESASAHAFSMMAQSLRDEIKYATKDMTATKKSLASLKETKATAEGDLTVTSKELAEDEDTKANLHQDCIAKSQDYEAEVKSRAEELKALAEAKKAIMETTSGAQDQQYGALDQQDVSFLQEGSINANVNAMSSGADLANFEAVRLVRDLARKEHSPALAQLAQRMAAVIRSSQASGADPFGKVKDLIRDMIEKLEGDAQKDASHKAYCDKEMGETKTKLEDKKADIEKLTTKIDSMSAKTATLKEDVAALQQALAELASSMAESTSIRQEEHKNFVANKADMEGGLEGIKMALKILREYYNKAADAEHDAASGAGSGIMGLLEVVESDFTKTIAEMTITEQTAATDYEREEQSNKISKVTKEQDVTYKTKEHKGLDSSIAEAGSDLESVRTELAAVLEYNKKIIEICVAKPESYGERKGRREAEIAGLKEALSILAGEAVLLQRQASLRGVARH